MAAVKRLYPDPGTPASSKISEPCESLPASLIAAKDTDGAWKARDSWVWREQPVFANQFVRLFQCAAPAERTAEQINLR